MLVELDVERAGLLEKPDQVLVQPELENPLGLAVVELRVELARETLRLEAFLVGGGTYAYGSYGDIDGLFLEQASDLDPKRREATLHRIQQLVHDKAVVAPIWLNAGMNGLGPRVEESGIGLIAGYIFSAPYEDVKLKPK